MAKDSSIYKYNVFTLAKDLDLDPQIIRQRLSRAEVEKNDDGMYGWNSQMVYRGILKQVRDVGRPPTKIAAAKTKTPKKVGRKKVTKRGRSKPTGDEE